MTKVTSSRKRNANRANARHSTGPRTRAGKSRSRLNALTHGAFLTCDVLISTGDGEENQPEFDQLLAGLVEDWRPVGQRKRCWCGKSRSPTDASDAC